MGLPAPETLYVTHPIVYKMLCNLNLQIIDLIKQQLTCTVPLLPFCSETSSLPEVSLVPGSSLENTSLDKSLRYFSALEDVVTLFFASEARVSFK